MKIKIIILLIAGILLSTFSSFISLSDEDFFCFKESSAVLTTFDMAFFVTSQVSNTVIDILDSVMDESTFPKPAGKKPFRKKRMASTDTNAPKIMSSNTLQLAGFTNSISKDVVCHSNNILSIHRDLLHCPRQDIDLWLLILFFITMFYLLPRGAIDSSVIIYTLKDAVMPSSNLRTGFFIC
ncbi:MAG: hypothetical protein JW871_00950, partial [Endomicrobiales bacterium]|nr:hypothetical protein [Endomicrobiales bacterium]